MLIKNQKVTVKWNGANIPWFKSKGYPFTKRFDEFQVDVEDLSPGSVEYVLVECDVCHKTYYKQYKNHLIAMNKGGDFCTKCKGIKTSTTTKNKHRDSTWNKIQYAAKQMDYEIITPYSKINSTHDKIKYKCKIHGEQQACINNFVNLHGCNQCALLIRKNKTKNDIDKVISTIESINNNRLINPNEYVNAHTRNLKIKCGICNTNIFTTCYANYKKGQNRCEKCSMSMSRNEKRIEDYLKSMKIDFKREKTFPDCRDKNPLPFDFYLPRYNLCIEFDGEQHFNDHMYKTRCINNPNIHLQYTQRHDQIKNQYCQNNRIHLLRIPYYKENHIEELINNKIIEIS